ncbi:hypothetical protein M427DRAFT_194446 [Gonapodya prolifera JEL478]|uniref:Uncharacterized protein n=1 Tax=Gonapodya prolifera (strain JEL478) TaxID=1344416 RepID=A0A139APA6_GONPJ|nr:hypothetical protein M427DRAFT_194446 [Gonapodya prolifera JEL478]|eukprot:KXS18558.1 hypothetical protein M427DRAFT_194446 [Gonapodya prolifera JEL478]
MASEQILNTNVDPEVALWTFFVYCLVVVLVAVFILFYMNRIIAQVVSRIIRLYTWKRYNAMVEIESFSLSPLSGKIFFRNVRYQSRNESFHVFRGYLVFRHWLGKVAGNEDDQDFPCRFGAYLEGLEWFIYNRSPAYDYLEEVLKKASGGTSNGERGNGEEAVAGKGSPERTPLTLFLKNIKLRLRSSRCWIKQAKTASSAPFCPSISSATLVP